MKKINSSCPVPKDQQPMYEYENLKNSMFFFWTTEGLKSYISKLSIVILLNCIVFGTLLNINIPFENNLPKQVILTSLIVDSVLILFLIRIYLGWEYIYNRLKNATVSYEESGWYDGQVWIKTPDILIKDRLIADYVLIPILKRIKFTLSILIGYFTIGLLNT